MTILTFEERAPYCISSTAQRLFTIMAEKKSNLALSADVTSSEALLKLADQLGPLLCVLKTHIDIIHDFHPALINELKQLAIKHQFLLFEDRKFADIGHTVKFQYSDGIYRIADWAHLTNAHALPGPGVIKGLAEIGRKKNRGLLLIAEMSSQNHLLDENYQNKTLTLAQMYQDFVLGFITQHSLSNDPHWIYFAPGIQLETGSDDLGQRYVTPEMAILEYGIDIIIAGRGILKASDPYKAAQEYLKRSWAAYLNRCG